MYINNYHTKKAFSATFNGSSLQGSKVRFLFSVTIQLGRLFIFKLIIARKMNKIVL